MPTEINVMGLFEALRPENVRRESQNFSRPYAVRLSDFAQNK